MPKLIGNIFSHRRLEAIQKATTDASPFPFLLCLKPAAHTWSKSSEGEAPGSPARRHHKSAVVCTDASLFLVWVQKIPRKGQARVRALKGTLLSQAGWVEGRGPRLFRHLCV